MEINQQIEALEQEKQLLEQTDFSELSKKHSFYTRAAVGCFSVSMKKANAGTIKTFCEGLLGGIFISIGYIVAMVAMTGVNTNGIRQIIFGVTFPVGMLLVTFLGGGLYTSHCLGFLNATLKNVKMQQYMKNLFLMFFANFVGCFIAAGLVILTGFAFKLDTSDEVANGYGVESMKMIIHKLGPIGEKIQQGNPVTGYDMGITFLNFLASGIFCNILVAGTLYLTFSSDNAAASVLLIFVAIFAFCVGGFQHVVANCFVFWTDIFSLGHYMDQVKNLKLPPITIVYFFVFNLIPAFIGNFIGGALLIPILGYIINKKVIDQLNKKLQLDKVNEAIFKLRKSLAI